MRTLSDAWVFVLLLVLQDRGAQGQYLDGTPSKRDESQDSTSRNLYLVSHDDFCIYGPPDPFKYIWDAGKNVVSWCSKKGHGSRLIPDGTLHGVTYVKAKDWVQVSGTGDFTKINIAPGDKGGQFDSSKNAPDGATVFTSQDNSKAAAWVTLISADTFCVRACTGDPKYCPSTYDQMGCWFFTGNSVGKDGTWQDCESENGDPPGVVDGTTFSQGAAQTPKAQAADPSNCKAASSVGNGQPAPPLFSWNGKDKAVPISGGGAGGAGPTGATGGKGDGAKSTGGAAPPGSTSWVEVQTCTPCGGSGAAGPTASSPAKGGTTGGTATQPATQQQGVSKVQGNDGLQAAELHAPITTPSKAAAGDDLLHRRAEPVETTTKDGQCCWKTSTLAGGGPTSSATKSSSGTAALGGTLTAKPTTSAGSAGASGGSSSGTGTLASGSATASLNGTAAGAAGNASASGNHSSPALALKFELVSVEGLGRLLGSILLALGVGGVMGGYTLLYPFMALDD